MNDIVDKMKRTRTYVRYNIAFPDILHIALKDGVKTVSNIAIKYIIDKAFLNLEVSLLLKFLKLLLTEKYPNTARSTIGTIGIIPMMKLSMRRANMTKLGPVYVSNIIGIEKMFRIFIKNLVSGYSMNMKEINERILKYISNILLSFSLTTTRILT